MKNYKKYEYKCALVLNNLEIPVYLGVTAKERAKKQKVLMMVKIDFSQLPPACKTGNIADTVCYDVLIQKIKRFCCRKKFTLIESLGAQLFALIKRSIFKDKCCKLSLRIAKQYPLLELSQSVFEISD
jgi:FolB domain-containing protein